MDPYWAIPALVLSGNCRVSSGKTFYRYAVINPKTGYQGFIPFMVNVLCSTFAGKGYSDRISLNYLTTESGSSLVGQKAKYSEVVGSNPV